MRRDKKKITVCGHFAIGADCFDGQTVKTRAVYDQLVKKYGENELGRVDTYGWKKSPLATLKSCIIAGKTSEHILIMPAHKGIRIFAPLFVILRDKYHFKLHYIVIGGWLYDLTKTSKKLANYLKRIDYIYLENKGIISLFEKAGFRNLEYMPNFKALEATNYRKRTGRLLRCCIFSRIEKEKGLMDAVNTVKRYNNNHKKKVSLDIYGKIKEAFKNEFNEAISGDDYIRYQGIVEANKSVEVVEKYDLLLFPTKYRTEGVPGTIIDAMFAGTPVLASKWENFDDMIREGVTGFGYEFGDTNDLYDKLDLIAERREDLSKMRDNCLIESQKYTPNRAMRALINNLDG